AAKSLGCARIDQHAPAGHAGCARSIEEPHATWHRLEVAGIGIAIVALLHREIRRRPGCEAAVEEGYVRASEVPEQPPGSRGGGRGCGVVDDDRVGSS